jgi:TRAP-type mannitol/chloroaromatic compound transport system substrate-binding protein
LGLHDAAKYYYYPGWHEPGPTLEAIVNRSAWEELPEDLKMILETATRAVNQDMLDEFTARNNAALKTLLEDHAVELRRLPDDVLARFKELSAEVVAEAAGENELARRIHDSYVRFRSDVMNYHRISEQAYINAR